MEIRAGLTRGGRADLLLIDEFREGVVLRLTQACSCRSCYAAECSATLQREEQMQLRVEEYVVTPLA